MPPSTRDISTDEDLLLKICLILSNQCNVTSANCSIDVGKNEYAPVNGSSLIMLLFVDS